MFLSFEHLWESFINVLKFQSEYQNREVAIDRYQLLRKEYIQILQSLEIKKIAILTHANYNIENIESVEYFEFLEFDTIIKEAKEKDKLIAFDFQNILNATTPIQLDSNFLEKSELEIILLDNFG